MDEIRFNYDSFYANVCFCSWVTVIIIWLVWRGVCLCFYVLIISLFSFFLTVSKISNSKVFCCLPFIKTGEWYYFCAVVLFETGTWSFPLLQFLHSHLCFDYWYSLSRLFAWRECGAFCSSEINMLLSFLLLLSLSASTGKDIFIKKCNDRIQRAGLQIYSDIDLCFLLSLQWNPGILLGGLRCFPLQLKLPALHRLQKVVQNLILTIKWDK